VDYGADEPLRRAILADRGRRKPGLADLIRAEAGQPVPPAPSPPPTRPGLPRPVEPLPIFDHLKQPEADHEPSA